MHPKIELWFEKFAVATANYAGHRYAMFGSMGLVLGWAAMGPLFSFSETWQLWINTLTTVMTFLMVFLIQKSLNRSTLAMQIKLNELLAASDQASNRLVAAESMTEKELAIMERFYTTLASMAQEGEELTESHSIDKT